MVGMSLSRSCSSHNTIDFDNTDCMEFHHKLHSAHNDNFHSHCGMPSYKLLQQ